MQTSLFGEQKITKQKVNAEKIAFAKQTHLLNSATKSKGLPIGILKSQRNPTEGQWKFLTKLVMLPNSEIAESYCYQIFMEKVGQVKVCQARNSMGVDFPRVKNFRINSLGTLFFEESTFQANLMPDRHLISTIKDGGEFFPTGSRFLAKKVTKKSWATIWKN